MAAARSLLALLVLAPLGACHVSGSASASADAVQPARSPAKAAPEEPASPSPGPAGASKAASATVATPTAHPDPGPGEPDAKTPAADGPVESTGEAACEDGEHRPGETWKEDCNTCRCNDAGKILCTRMACRGGER